MPYTTLHPYFENVAGCLFAQPAGRYIVVRYYPGPRGLPDLQALLTQAGELLTRNNWHKLLDDQRLLAPFSPEQLSWVAEYWLKHVLHCPGGCYGAVLLPHNVFARLSVSQVMTNVKAAAMTYQLFDDDEAAQQWLRNLA